MARVRTFVAVSTVLSVWSLILLASPWMVLMTSECWLVRFAWD